MSTASSHTVRGLGAPRRGGLEPGEVLDGKYRIVRLIAQGGTGSVYEGEHRLIARKVAIKVLHSHIAEDDVAVRRFEREARATAQIGSENIVDVLDLGELPNGDRYLVMEYLEGESLRDFMQRPARPVEFVQLVLQLLSALGAAHRVGIVHRDVKPENVFIARRKPTDPPVVKVLDFGVSKSQERQFDSEMTGVGTIIGTPYYMAPEQALGNSVDARADIYSVGVMMFQGLAGQLPYKVDSFTQLVVKLSLEAPVKLRSVAPHVDPMLADIVDRAMARAPDDRFPSADALSDALGSWLARQSGRSDHGGAWAPPDRASSPYGAMGGPGAPPPTPSGAGQARSTMRSVGAETPGPAGYGGSFPAPGYPGAPVARPAGELPPTMQLPAQAPPPAMGARPRAVSSLGFEIAADPTIVAFTKQRQRRLRGVLAVLWTLAAIGAAGAVALVVVPPSDASSAATGETAEPTEPAAPSTDDSTSTTTSEPPSTTDGADAAAPSAEPTSSSSASPEPTTTAKATSPKTKTPTSSGGSGKTSGKGTTPKGASSGGKSAVDGRKIQTEL